MSDLSTKIWAVISYRGLEVNHLNYEEARELVHQLGSEGRHGLCIVTTDTADRLQASAKTSNRSGSAATRVREDLLRTADR